MGWYGLMDVNEPVCYSRMESRNIQEKKENGSFGKT